MIEVVGSIVWPVRRIDMFNSFLVVVSLMVFVLLSN